MTRLEHKIFVFVSSPIPRYNVDNVREQKKYRIMIGKNLKKTKLLIRDVSLHLVCIVVHCCETDYILFISLYIQHTSHIIFILLCTVFNIIYKLSYQSNMSTKYWLSNIIDFLYWIPESIFPYMYYYVSHYLY